MPIVPQNIPKPQQQNRTEVGVRGLRQSSQPSALKKGGRKAKAKTEGSDASALDRVSREDENLLVEEVGEDRRRQGRGRNRQGYAELEAAPGHTTTMLRRKGRAFRIDEQGRKIPPHFSDVEQGNLQDSWLLATFAAVAAAQPGAIVQRVVTDPSGDFAVRLGDQAYSVSPEFPTEGYACVEPRNLQDTLWVALLEKAFALDSACSYAELEAGNPSRALPMLVEGESLRHRVRISGDAQRQAARLRAYRTGQNPMVIVTRTANVPTPFIADHAYAIVDVDTAGNVTFYNPWGTRRASRPLDTVVHSVAWAEARTAFEFLHVGGIA